MESESKGKKSDFRARFFIILARPERAENVGSVARAMKNTGFGQLRIVGQEKIEPSAYRTAVHAGEILDGASFYPDLWAATADLNIIFASTAKPRKNFSTLPLGEAVDRMFSFPASVRIGLVFGNERTGLTSEELRASNFRLTIPQAGRQPSYNLASAVLLALFAIFCHGAHRPKRGLSAADAPLSRAEQEECIRLILNKLEEREFIHATNKVHTAEMVSDLLGRLAITAKDKKLLLAMFSQVGRHP
jgi:TrmH family RNA methyltransferase